MGFSTGKWEGHMLTVTTTHLKVGWIQRNGVAHSDKATMTEHYMRLATDCPQRQRGVVRKRCILSTC